MGQACCGGYLRRFRGGRRQYRHNKGYDFAPKHSWKYKDANLLSSDDFDEDGGMSGLAVASVTSAPHPAHQQQEQPHSLEHAEVNTVPGQTRTARLSFRNGSISSSSSEEGEGFIAAPTHVPSAIPAHALEEGRKRTESNTSEQIGRFEVMNIVDEEEVGVATEPPAETSKLLTVSVEHRNSNGNTTNDLLLSP